MTEFSRGMGWNHGWSGFRGLVVGVRFEVRSAMGVFRGVRRGLRECWKVGSVSRERWREGGRSTWDHVARAAGTRLVELRGFFGGFVA